MNKQDLIGQVADRAGLTRSDSSRAVETMLEVISSGMGTLYRPVGIRRKAAATADATRLLGNAQQDVDTSRMLAIASAESANKFVLAEASLRI